MAGTVGDEQNALVTHSVTEATSRTNEGSSLVLLARAGKAARPGRANAVDHTVASLAAWETTSLSRSFRSACTGVQHMATVSASGVKSVSNCLRGWM